MQRSFRRIAEFSLVVLSIVVLGLSASGQSLVQDRIVQSLADGKISALAGTVSPKARAEYDQGAVDGSMRLSGMSMTFAPTASQQAALTSLMKAQQTPSSPSYRKWLTPQEYAARFGMSQADIAKVSSWLQSQGFTVDKVADSQNAIWFSGTAATAEAAFHTAIHNYSVNGETHFANAAPVSIPSALAGSVIQVGGLSDFKLKPHVVRPSSANQNGLHPDFTSGASGYHSIQPGDFAVIYDMNPLYSGGLTGSGVTIGVIGQTDIVMADITSFRAASSPALPAYGTAGGPTFTNFLIPTSADPGISYNDIGEADIDIEWSGGVATNANIIYVNSTNVLDSLQYAIANQINSLTIPILTMSYAGCEVGFSSAEVNSLETSFQQANVQGQTVLNSSGDSGAAACDVQTNPNSPITTATQGLAVNYPASSAFVTGVGGSEFMGDGTAANPSLGSDTYWTANGSNDVITSAKSYIPEMAWNDTTFAIANGGGLSAGGGGVSTLFAKPTWQAGVAGIPADNSRDVPDISLDASADHDPYLICTQVQLASNGSIVSSCTNGFRLSDPGGSDDTFLQQVGGTSVAAPAFAGILAVIEGKLGTPLGNIDPYLYTLAANSTVYATAFHDVTTGNIIVPCTPGTPSTAGAATQCPSSGQFGYSAGTGYDQATGLGTVDGNALATAFATLSVTPGTTTTLTVSPAAPVVEDTVTLTATVAASAGTVTPTGSVVFTVDGTALPSVAVAAGVAMTTTSFSTGGIHKVTAAYTPGTNDNFFSSTTTQSITVQATGGISTSTAIVLTPATTVAVGGSLTIAATVTANPATGTLPGTVNFFAGADTSGTQLNPSPVAVTPTTPGVGTASFTVSNVQLSQGFVVGLNSVTAHYTGNSGYAESSGTATITVTNPGLTMTVANMTISGPAPGNTGSSAIVVTSTGGYAGAVDLTATATSLNASYTITPAEVTIASGGTGSATISIQTVAADIQKGVSGNLRKTQTSSNRAIAGTAAAFGFIFLLGIPGFRKKRWPMLTMLLLLGALGTGIGCGGGGGGGGSGGSPAGTYTVTVIATDSVNSNITVSTNFTVTIK